MKYVAFLRGINVGGKNKIKMETLREVCSALGFKNVKTYINSGNVIFETAKSDNQKLAAIIEKAIEKEFSLSIKVMIRNCRKSKISSKTIRLTGNLKTIKICTFSF